MKPFTLKEIDSLLCFKSAEKKMMQVMQDVNMGSSYIENNSNYILKCWAVKGHFCFYGFRFDTQWYYKVPLLNEKPEIIVYLKDIEQDISKADSKNKHVYSVYDNCKAQLEKKFECKVNYYKRKRANECRLAIRKSLEDFENQDIDELTKWFAGILKFMEPKL